MPEVTFLQPDGSAKAVELRVGESLMRCAVLNKVAGIVAECGGGAMCGTCHIFIERADGVTLPPMHDEEDERLYCTATPRRANSRLSCQVPATDALDGLVVRVAERQL
jgi:2Fe-2S ferredoxin